MNADLATRYADLGLGIADGGEWDALIEPWVATSLFGIDNIIDEPPLIDRQLHALGNIYLERLRERGSNLFDGPVLALGSSIPGLLTLRPGGYLDHIRCAETLSAEWRERGRTPLRDRLDERAGGDPLHNGSGRCAALAVCALLVWDGPEGPQFVLGQRNLDVAVGPGMWHIVPAGMVEPGANALVDTLTRELGEEVALEAGEGARACAGVSVLGLVFNLERLQTEVSCLLVVGGSRPLLDSDEHGQARWWPYTEAGLVQALTELGPEQLMPTAAGTIELARWRLRLSASSSPTS